MVFGKDMTLREPTEEEAVEISKRQEMKDFQKIRVEAMIDRAVKKETKH